MKRTESSVEEGYFYEPLHKLFDSWLQLGHTPAGVQTFP